MISISIILPIYNVESYIQYCLESIISQEIDNCLSLECILVDDCTPDNSMTIARNVIKEYNGSISFVYLKHEKNRGLSASRNTGLSKAKGDYIMFIDSDDLLINNSLYFIVETASKTNADLIVADYVSVTDENIRHYHHKPQLTYKTIFKSGSELFLQDLSPSECYVWRTIYKRKFLLENNLFFIEGLCFEDIPFTHKCYLVAGNCVRMYYSFYIYRRRKGALSTVITKKTVLDLNRVIEIIWEFMFMKHLTIQEKNRLKDNTFVTLSLNLWYISKHKEILIDRKEIVNDLKDRIPNLYFSNGWKQRMVSFFFKTMPCTYLKIRSLI